MALRFTGWDRAWRPSSSSGPAWLEVGVYRRSDVGRLAIHLADGTTTQRLLLGPIKVVAR